MTTELAQSNTNNSQAPNLIPVEIYIAGDCDDSDPLALGSWSATIAYGDETYELGGSVYDTTKDCMAMQALIHAFAYTQKHILPEAGAVKVYTDSNYLIQGLTEGMPKWKARAPEWTLDNGEPPEHLKLWQALEATRPNMLLIHDVNELDGIPGTASNKPIVRSAKQPLGAEDYLEKIKERLEQAVIGQEPKYFVELLKQTVSNLENPTNKEPVMKAELAPVGDEKKRIQEGVRNAKVRCWQIEF